MPDEIELRLERWGLLARGGYVDLGFPTHSAHECDMTAEDWARLHLPDDVVDTDRAVARLPRRYKRALKVQYMLDLPTNEKVKILGTSRASFFLRLNAGKVGVWMTLLSLD